MTATGYLALRMLLTETAVLRNGFTPLHVASEPVIPGRVQRGMLAAALHRTGGSALIHDWVAAGEAIRFAPALPFVESSPGHGTAAVPAPATLHCRTPDGGTGHDTRELVDLLSVRGRLAGAATPDGAATGRRLEGFILPAERPTPVEVAVHTEQYLGTGRGGEPLQGVPFLTTMLDAGQLFEARWRLRAESPDALRSLADHVMAVLEQASGSLVLGTGSTRAHGGRPEIRPPADGPLAEDRVRRTEPWAAGDERDLVLLAPALVVDDYGEPRPGALPRAVAALCADVLGDAVEQVGSVVEAAPVEGYHRMYRSAMAARWAAAAGSAVRLQARRDLTAEQVRALEARAVGLRQVDGHGCFVLLKPASEAAGAPLPEAKSIRPAAALRLPDGTEAPTDAPDPGGEVAALHDRMLRDAVAEPLRARARRLAGRAENLPSPSLLGRLREVAAQPVDAPADGDSQRAHREVLHRLAAVVAGRSAAAHPHKAFTDKARDAAARCLVRGGEGAADTRRTLPRWLREAADHGDPWWQDFAPRRELADAIAPVDLHPAADAGGLSAPARRWLADNRPWMVHLLVGTWLVEAARHRRREDERKERQ